MFPDIALLGAQAVESGGAAALGHTEALLQELFAANAASSAAFAPGLSAQLLSALAAGREAFPMAALAHGSSSAHPAVSFSAQQRIAYSQSSEGHVVPSKVLHM